MASKPGGLAVIIGSKRGDSPPPLASPDPSSKMLGGMDRSQQFCSNCKFYCTDAYCMMYPEWQAHDASDWCGQWAEGQPRDLKGDAAKSQPQSQPPTQNAGTGSNPQGSMTQG